MQTQITSRLKKFIATHKKTSLLALILLVLFFFFWQGQSADTSKKTVVVTRGTVESRVLVSGKVKSATDASLAFQKNGVVATVYKNAGDEVKNGEIIMALDARDDLATLDRERAVLKQKRAQFASLTGSYFSENDTQTSIAGQSAKQLFIDSVSNGYTAIIGAHNALYNTLVVELDPFFNNDSGISPTLTFDVSQTQKQVELSTSNGNRAYTESEVRYDLREQAQNQRVQAETALNQLKSFIILGKENSNMVFENLVETESRLEDTQVFLIVLSDAVNNSSLDATTLAEYKATLDTVRDSITLALGDVKESRQTIQEKNLAYQKSTHYLLNENGDPVAADISEQEANIEEAAARVRGAEATYDNNFLRAPFDGILVTRDVDQGENVTAETVIARVIEPAGLRVEADVSEIDVPKLSAGAPGTISFDAYGRDILFPAHIASIDPGEKDIEGVPTYRTIISLDTKDERIRTGMTVNIDILAGKRDNVLQIPVRSIYVKDGERYVKILNGDNTEEVKIETGLRGNNGVIEVIEGLHEGDLIQIQ